MKNCPPQNADKKPSPGNAPEMLLDLVDGDVEPPMNRQLSSRASVVSLRSSRWCMRNT